MIAVRHQNDRVLGAAGSQVRGLDGAQPLRRSSGSLFSAAACLLLLAGPLGGRVPRCLGPLRACCWTVRMWERLLVLLLGGGL